MTRLELATSYVTGRRSNRLSYTPVLGQKVSMSECQKVLRPTAADFSTFGLSDFLTVSGGQNRTRTCDIFRVKEALFQLSYPPR